MVKTKCVMCEEEYENETICDEDGHECVPIEDYDKAMKVEII